jgi:hypothetical protein
VSFPIMTLYYASRRPFKTSQFFTCLGIISRPYEKADDGPHVAQTQNNATRKEKFIHHTLGLSVSCSIRLAIITYQLLQDSLGEVGNNGHELYLQLVKLVTENDSKLSENIPAWHRQSAPRSGRRM